MKILFRILAFLSCITVIHAQWNEEDERAKQNSESNIQWWKSENHYTLHLHDELTLQDCLDAGIRPRHVPGLAGHTLHFQAKIFSLIIPNGNTIICENGYGRLTVSKDYKISTVAFYEEKFVGFERCRERLLHSNKGYEGKKTVRDIDAFLDSVRVAEDHWTGNNFVVGSSTRDVSGDKFWISNLVARNRGTRELPFRFMMMTEIRHRDSKDAYEYHDLGVLLSPPAGYEDISFNYISPPEDPHSEVDSQQFLTPLEQAKMISEKHIKSSAGDAYIPSTTQDKQGNKSKYKNENILPWIFLGLLLMLSILLFFFKRLRD